MRRLALIAFLFVSACGTPPTDIEATIATRLALTDTAMAPAAPSSTPTEAATKTSTPLPTATQTQTPVPGPTATNPPDALRLDYGERKSYAPRQESWAYFFEGKEGDIVGVAALMSNAHPDVAQCRNLGAAASFTLRNPGGDTVEPVHRDTTTHEQRFQLTSTGMYSIVITCSGTDCNAFCAQVDTSLELKP